MKQGGCKLHPLAPSASYLVEGGRGQVKLNTPDRGQRVTGDECVCVWRTGYMEFIELNREERTAFRETSVAWSSPESDPCCCVQETVQEPLRRKD